MIIFNSYVKLPEGTTFLDVVLKPEIYWRFRPQLALPINLGWPPRHPVAHQPMLTLRVELREKTLGTGLSNKKLETSETSTFLREADVISMMFVRQYFDVLW